MNTENSKINELHQFVLNLPQRLHLRSSNKHVALQNLSIYYTWKKKKKKKKKIKQYKKNKIKIIARTWIDEFELPDGLYSLSDIQDYIGYIVKKHEKLTTIPPIHV